MSETIRRPRLRKWLLAIPDDVPKETRRYYIYWRVFYFLGALAHFLGMLALSLAGVDFMVAFNLVSVPLFVLAFVLLRRGRYQLAFWLVNIELVAHGIAATICVGPAAGFQCYIFPVVILAFVQPFYGFRRSALIAVGALATVAALMAYMVGRPPVYAVSPNWMTFISVACWTGFPIIVIAMVRPFIAEALRAEKELEAAYGESEGLLLNILPAPIAARLKRSSGMIADDHDRVAILFADIVGFTDLSDRLQPAEVVGILNEVFNAFDALAERYCVEKIKTIGDAYMVVAGVPDADGDPERTIARLALDMQRVAEGFTEPVTGNPVRLRIGINSGRVVAGVIGQRKFAYDLWGDAVNVAARMEATGEPGRIHLPEDMARGLAGRFAFEPRGTVEVKGKGSMRTCFLTGEMPD